MTISIVHHLGLGDQIMLNGMVRHFAEKDDVRIFCKKNQEPSIRFMYRDLGDKVDVFTVDSDDPKLIWSNIKGRVIPLATYGIPDQPWKMLMHGDPSILLNWAHSIYIQAGIPPKYMYSKFRVDRDVNSEINETGDFVFIHDDPERGMNIVTDNGMREFRITRDRLSKNPNIFDYISVIENAKEVHCMDSCYAWMIELMELGNPSRNFLHVNTKVNYSPRMVHTVFSEDVWTLISQ